MFFKLYVSPLGGGGIIHHFGIGSYQYTDDTQLYVFLFSPQGKITYRDHESVLSCCG